MRRWAPFTLTIPAQRSHAAAVFTLTPQDDNTDEGDETVSVSGTATGLQVAIATLVLSDNDQASTGLRVQLSQQTVSEGAGNNAIPVTVALNGAARTVDTEVTMTVSGSDSDGEVGFAADRPVDLHDCCEFHRRLYQLHPASGQRRCRHRGRHGSRWSRLQPG